MRPGRVGASRAGQTIGRRRRSTAEVLIKERDDQVASHMTGMPFTRLMPEGGATNVLVPVRRWSMAAANVSSALRERALRSLSKGSHVSAGQRRDRSRSPFVRSSMALASLAPSSEVRLGT